jgi:cell division protein FtsB
MADKGKNSGTIIVGLVVVLVLGGMAVLGRQGLMDMIRLTGQKESLIQENQALKERNQRMMSLISRLKDEPQAAEELARAELGLARSGEIVYVFRSSSSQTGMKVDHGRPGTGSQN